MKISNVVYAYYSCGQLKFYHAFFVSLQPLKEENILIKQQK